MLAAALWLAPTGGGASSGDRTAAKPYSAFASCGAKGKHADAFCFEGDRPVAVFRAFGRRDAAYRVCARKRGGRKHCDDRRTNNPGQCSRTRFDLDGSGKQQLAFFEGGRSVDRDSLVIRERTVFAVGDSLGEGTRPYLAGALARWKVDPVGLDLAPRPRGRLDPA